MRETLELWMQGARQNHPVRRELALGLLEPKLDELDRLLATLERCGPARLPGKRRDFRQLRSASQWADLHTELSMAAWIAGHGVEVEFGAAGEPQPDLVLPKYGFGIELTRRQRDGAQALRRTLMRALVGISPRPRPVVRLNGQPLAIRDGVLAQVAVEVRAAAERGDPGVRAVVRPARELCPAVTADIRLYGGRSAVPKIVLLPEASELTVPMLDIEDLIVSCLEDPQKARQGASMPTMLMIDVTRLSSILWLRSPETWTRRLAALLEPQHAFDALGLIALGHTGPKLAIGIGGATDAMPREAMSRWASRMGIVVHEEA